MLSTGFVGVSGADDLVCLVSAFGVSAALGVTTGPRPKRRWVNISSSSSRGVTI
ncbi:hypothetical protein BC832DRAFT_44651 [Gaertneriomyces semiglobifer]|nr:hypothetical protein BC832DRAFT_44651 [Gaertneriomyces semiglobifer]